LINYSADEKFGAAITATAIVLFGPFKDSVELLYYRSVIIERVQSYYSKKKLSELN